MDRRPGRGCGVAVVRTKAEVLTILDAQYAEFFRQHPFCPTRDLVPALRRLLTGPGFKQATDSL